MRKAREEKRWRQVIAEREKTEMREKQMRERTARNREKGRGAIADGRRYEREEGAEGRDAR